ncbi:MAG: L,D-transpeptidase family protein [Saccharofermentanales bacterium]
MRHKRLISLLVAVLILSSVLLLGSGGTSPSVAFPSSVVTDPMTQLPFDAGDSGSDPGESEIEEAWKLFGDQWGMDNNLEEEWPEWTEPDGEPLEPLESSLSSSSSSGTQKTTARTTTRAKVTTTRTTTTRSTTAWPISGTSQHPYLIYVSMNSFTIQILGLDQNLQYTRELRRFSTGIGRNTHQTRTGIFHVTGKESWHTWNNRPPTYSPYVTSYSGGVWIHGPIYKEKDPNEMVPGSYNVIGTACSSGCLRTTCSAAAWIYYNCSVGTTVIVQNDSRYSAPRPAPVHENQTWDPTDPLATPEIPVTSFSLNTASLELTTVDNATLKAINVLPTNTSTTGWIFESRNPAVASVNSSGKITALAPGTAEIVVTADDIYGRSRSCTVLVKAPATTTTTTTTTPPPTTTTSTTTTNTTTTAPSTTTE